MQIHELNQLSGTPGDTSAFAIDNGTTTERIDYAALAKAIIEQYTGSTLAGSARSVKSAFAALLASINTNAGDIGNLNDTVYARTQTTATKFDDITESGLYWLNMANVTGGPATSGYCVLVVHGGTIKLQEAFIYSSSVNAMPRAYQRIYTNSQWYSWTCNNGELLTKIVSGQTTSAGSLSASLGWSRYVIVSAYSPGYVCVPYRAASASSLYIKVLNNDMTVAASTAVDVTITYIDMGVDAFS